MEKGIRFFWFFIANAFSVLALAVGSANAQSERCASAIIQDVGSLDLREAQSLAMSELLRKEQNYDKNWAAGVTVLIKGVPVSGSAKSAESTRERYFRKSQLNWTLERLVSIATQTLSRNAVDLYRICVEGQLRSGPRILVHDATRLEATITVTWQAPVGAKTQTNSARFDISGGQFKSSLPSAWTTGMSYSVIVERIPARDFRITANIGNESDVAFVSRIPDTPKATPTLVVAYCTGKGGQQGVRLWGPKGANCNGLPPSSGWGQYDGRTQRITLLGSCIGHDGFEGVTLWGPIGEPCGVPNGDWGTYNNPIVVGNRGIANCVGRGNILQGHLLWGPTGFDCGGFSGWGDYTEGRVIFTSLE